MPLLVSPQKGGKVSELQVVPSDMRQLPLRIDPSHAPRDESQPFARANLIPRLEEKLHSETDA